MQITTITIPRPLPFEPSEEQAIYIEGSYDVKVNDFLHKNFEDIAYVFHSHILDFCYMPQRIGERGSDLLVHHNPCVKKDCLPEVAYSTKEFVEELFGGEVPADLKPSVILYQQAMSTEDVACFIAIEIGQEIGKPIKDFRPWWKKLLGMDREWAQLLGMYDAIAAELARLLYYSGDNGGVFYSRVNWYSEALRAYMEGNEETFLEIDVKIHLLQERGVDALVLKKILCSMVDEQRPLSRLTVTSDLRIILNDYQDKEIRMEPINKAVFLLFLRHEEGIRLKEISDYRDELMSFYTRLSHDQMKFRTESVDTLLDPTCNSINEKISRVRQAFVSQFEEDLAAHYYITGKRGEAKRITLDRSLVTWE